MSPRIALATLDTLLDPATVVATESRSALRELVAICQNASLQCAPDSDYERAILERCQEVISRHSLYWLCIGP